MARKKKTESQQAYQKPHMGVILKRVSQEFGIDETKVLEFVQKTFPELLDKKTCANCGASMAMFVHSLDQVDALLLFGMGKVVGRRSKTMPFTEANQVHLQKELGSYYSVPARSSWCAKLGLIAKVMKKDGVHDSKAGWLITKRGFEFLAGKPVPKKVQTFRNQITERYDEMTTIGQVMNRRMDRAQSQELRTHGDFKFEQLEHWAIAGFAQGVLIK